MENLSGLPLWELIKDMDLININNLMLTNSKVNEAILNLPEFQPRLKKVQDQIERLRPFLNQYEGLAYFNRPAVIDRRIDIIRLGIQIPQEFLIYIQEYVEPGNYEYFLNLDPYENIFYLNIKISNTNLIIKPLTVAEVMSILEKLETANGYVYISGSKWYLKYSENIYYFAMKQNLNIYVNVNDYRVNKVLKKHGIELRAGNLGFAPKILILIQDQNRKHIELSEETIKNIVTELVQNEVPFYIDLGHSFHQVELDKAWKAVYILNKQIM